jgi:hypothetical protein
VVVAADAVEERAEELVRLEVDSARKLWPPLLRVATRRELTWLLGVAWQPTRKCRLGADDASDPGRRLGRLLDRPPLGATPAQLLLGRRVGPARLHKVEALLLGGGGWALVVGRGTAGARVVLPGLAGGRSTT